LLVLGIDPGRYGGCVVIDDNKNVVSKFSTPTILFQKHNRPGKRSFRLSKLSAKEKKQKAWRYDIPAIAQYLSKTLPSVDQIVLEWGASRPNQSASSTLAIGEGRMLWQCLCEMSGEFITQKIAPIDWTSLYGFEAGATKDDHLEKMLSLFPGEAEGDYRTKRGKLIDGVVDAILIANSYFIENPETN
jgi:hypothetical protein